MTACQDSSVPLRRSDATAPTKGDRRELALVAAATEHLTSGTFESVSVADLAAEAGISRATFYFYFTSKQDLLAATIEQAVAELESRLADVPPAAGARTDEVVAGTVRAAADLWWEHRVVLCASVELGSASPEVYDRNRLSIDRVSLLTNDLIGGDDGSARTITALVLMTERSFYDLARDDHPRAAYDDLADTLTTVWLRALGVG
jgi:TetR/AcrR family transcriptional regulator, ethionamide resistance regulator